MTESSVALPPVTTTESASCRPQPNIDNTLKNVWTVPALRVRKQREHSSLNSLNYGLQPQYKWTSGLTAKRPGRRATSNRAKSSAPKMPVGRLLGRRLFGIGCCLRCKLDLLRSVAFLA